MRNAIRQSLLVCGLLFFGAVRLPAETAAQFLEQGAAALSRGEPNEAAERLRSALANGLEGADLISAKSKLAEAHLRMGNPEKALETCNEVIRLAPEDAGPYTLRGQIHLQQGDNDRALVDFDHALKLDPKSSGAYNDRGMVYLRKGKPDEALRDLTESIRLQPNNAVARRNRAAYYLGKQNWQAALDDLDEAIDASPTSEDCRIRAFLYQNQGEKEMAAFDLETALKLDPNNARAYYDRATTHANDGAWGSAIADLTKSSELDPKNVDCLNWLARLLAACPDPAQRDGKKAVDAALKACELTEWKAAPSVDILAAAYARAGDFEAAQKFGKMALTLEGVAPAERPRMERRLDYYKAHMAFVLKPKP